MFGIQLKFEKAYESIDCSFMDHMTKMFGFEIKW